MLRAKKRGVGRKEKEAWRSGFNRKKVPSLGYLVPGDQCLEDYEKEIANRSEFKKKEALHREVRHRRLLRGVRALSSDVAL